MADTKQVKFGDRLITVPADTTQQELDAILQPQGSGFENLKSAESAKLKPGFFNPETPPAPYLGRLAANTLPAAGSVAGVPGTMIGTGISAILKATFPKVFGEPPESVPLEGIKDIVLNNAIPGAIGKGVQFAARGLKGIPASAAFKNFPATREGAAREMSQQILKKYQYPESGILETSAENAATKLSDLAESAQQAPNIQAGMAIQKELESVFGKNKVGQALAKLDEEFKAGTDVAKSQTYREISNMALSDLTHVRNWKLATGDRGIEDLAINRILTVGAKKEGTLSAVKMLSEIGGKNKEIYAEAIRPEAFNRFKDLINEIHSQQVGHAVSDSVIQYSKGRLVWASGLAGGLHGMFALPGATAVGITITNQLLSRAMSNPETARIVVEALRTPAGSQKGQIISQVLSNLWRGASDVGTVPEK